MIGKITDSKTNSASQFRNDLTSHFPEAGHEKFWWNAHAQYINSHCLFYLLQIAIRISKICWLFRIYVSSLKPKFSQSGRIFISFQAIIHLFTPLFIVLFTLYFLLFTDAFYLLPDYYPSPILLIWQACKVDLLQKYFPSWQLFIHSAELLPLAKLETDLFTDAFDLFYTSLLFIVYFVLCTVFFVLF